MFHTLLAALFCLMLPALTCADEIVGARVEYWSMGLSGDSSVSSGDFTLPTLSLTDSTDGLGLDSDNPVGGSAWLNLGPFFLFGRYTPSTSPARARPPRRSPSGARPSPAPSTSTRR